MKKFAELKPFPQIAYSAQLTPLLVQGQIAVAPIDLGEIVPLKQKGVPPDFVVPEEGMMIFDQSFSIPGQGRRQGHSGQVPRLCAEPRDPALHGQVSG